MGILMKVIYLFLLFSVIVNCQGYYRTGLGYRSTTTSTNEVGFNRSAKQSVPIFKYAQFYTETTPPDTLKYQALLTFSDIDTGSYTARLMDDGSGNITHITYYNSLDFDTNGWVPDGTTYGWVYGLGSGKDFTGFTASIVSHDADTYSFFNQGNMSIGMIMSIGNDNYNATMDMTITVYGTYHNGSKQGIAEETIITNTLGIPTHQWSNYYDPATWSLGDERSTRIYTRGMEGGKAEIYGIISDTSRFDMDGHWTGTGDSTHMKMDIDSYADYTCSINDTVILKKIVSQITMGHNDLGNISVSQNSYTRASSTLNGFPCTNNYAIYSNMLFTTGKTKVYANGVEITASPNTIIDAGTIYYTFTGTRTLFEVRVYP
jgi:hypothetical protein